MPDHRELAEWIQREADDYERERTAEQRLRYAIAGLVLASFLGGAITLTRLSGWSWPL